MSQEHEAAEQNFAPGTEIVVEIETPRFSFVKRKSDGGIDFISPIPSPFHYGFVPDTAAADGDPQDAIVLTDGPLKRGDRVLVRIAGRVAFVDAGCRDDKLICCTSERRVMNSDVHLMKAFFRSYAVLKRILGYLRRIYGQTVFKGIYIG